MDSNNSYGHEAFAEKLEVLSEFLSYNNAVRPVRATCRGDWALRLKEAAEQQLPQFHT